MTEAERRVMVVARSVEGLTGLGAWQGLWLCHVYLKKPIERPLGGFFMQGGVGAAAERM